tara:strand:- start:338 stop:655 length:318 start_codon:yes stop_codon:yes gene_type:complete
VLLRDVLLVALAPEVWVLKLEVRMLGQGRGLGLDDELVTTKCVHGGEGDDGGNEEEVLDDGQDLPDAAQGGCVPVYGRQVVRLLGRLGEVVRDGEDLRHETFAIL